MLQGKTVLHTVSWRSHTYTIFSFYRALMHWVDPTSLHSRPNNFTVQLQAKCSVLPTSLRWLSRELLPLFSQPGQSCLPLLAYKAMEMIYAPKQSCE